MDKIIEVLEKCGINKFTEIQNLSFPIIRDRVDALIMSKTGSGKTLAFVVPIMEKILKDRSMRVLVIVPTRELSAQIYETFKIFKSFNFKSVNLIGGESIYDQIKQLDMDVNITIGTPGRIAEHLRRGYSIDNVNILVLDETDKLLEMNFEEDLKFIETYMNKDRQNVFLSATSSGRVDEFVNEKFARIKIVEEFDFPAEMVHKFTLAPLKYKELYLIHLISLFKNESVIVFFSSCAKVEIVTKIFEHLNFKITPIHGNFKQKNRKKAISEFKETRKMFCTDLVARGLDLTVDLVINYDTPADKTIYLHRAGRTARAGRPGTVINIVTQYNLDNLFELESELGTKFLKVNVDKSQILGLIKSVETLKFKVSEESKDSKRKPIKKIKK